ncbi:unnamed protein product [Arabidopsis halleri]
MEFEEIKDEIVENRGKEIRNRNFREIAHQHSITRVSSSLCFFFLRGL